ncbi:MAG: uncharacterized protein JWP14_1156 [Frankiales bacterium]|nr:uncharacterized protein [Frankiales bacterium]
MLSAANTGAPLTQEGVAALASLRASAKRDGRTVGRFGVGFAAVAAVADEVVVASTTGAVRFSRARTLAAVRAVPALHEELVRRDGRVPLLRLPWDADSRPREGFDTEVLVQVRPDAVGDVRAMLDAIDPTLLLVLPGLRSIEVDGRRLTQQVDGDDVVVDGVRWRVLSRAGELDPAVLRGRPVEEQTQTHWSVTWAVPVQEGLPQPLPDGVASVLRAPTPTDDPMSLPAVLAASLPLGPDRRRVQPGPLTDAVLSHAATALADLVDTLPDDPSRLALVPPALAAGEIDAALGSLALQALSARVPSGTIVLEGADAELVGLLRDVLPGLLPHTWSATGLAAPLRRLGVPRMTLAELTEALAGLDRPASWWGRVYAALPPDVDQLGSLPVPLTDGSLAPSPRGLLLAHATVDLTPLGFRVVAPEARHDLLLRLGAQHAEPRALLEDPRVRGAVDRVADEESWEDEEVAAVVEAVLALVGGAALRPGELPWLAELPLPTLDGESRPAGELLLPGSPLAAVMDLEAGFGLVADGVAHPDVLTAVGVLADFVEVPATEEVDLVDAWLATLPPGREPGPVVRDLDLVLDWARALPMLERHLTPYVTWWLARHRVLDGRRPATLRLPDADPLLHGLLDPTSHPLAERIGAVRRLEDVDPALLLERLADPSRHVRRDQVRAVHAHLSRLEDLPLPERVRAVVDGQLQVVPADDAVVVDRPDLLGRVSPYAVVPVPLADARALADALDLALASEVLDDADLPGAGPLVEHERLVVPTAGGVPIAVPWALVGGVDHVSGPEGRAQALAWRAGDWTLRHALLAELLAELRLGEGSAEADLDPV